MLDNVSQVWPAQNTTNSYADLGAIWDKRNFDKATIVVSNAGGTNGATAQLLGSVDKVTWVAVGTSNNIAANGTQVLSISVDYWPYLKLQVKAQVGGSQTSVTAAGAAVAD